MAKTNKDHRAEILDTLIQKGYFQCGSSFNNGTFTIEKWINIKVDDVLLLESHYDEDDVTIYRLNNPWDGKWSTEKRCLAQHLKEKFLGAHESPSVEV